MPFYFRKSFGSGPFRINFSKSGIGVSAGARGLRIGTGPRGTYIRAGRGGIYYQQYLRTSRAVRASGGIQTAPSAELTQKELEFVGSPSATPDSFIEDVNSRRSAFRFSGLGIVATLFLLFQGNARHFPGPALALILGALVFAIWLRLRENAGRRIELAYELDETARAQFDVLCAAVRAGSECSRVWRIETQRGVTDYGKRTAGATTLITRKLATIRFSSRDIRANVKVPTIFLKAAQVCFLPDRVLVIAGSKVNSLRYSDLVATASGCNYREMQGRPSDATQIGTTWTYVNRNGGPDRRFKNNRQIPIYEYSEFAIKSSGVTFVLHFSRRGAGVPIAAAIAQAGKSA